MKSTQKYLPNLPYDFFFGATENEFNLAKKLKGKYRFAMVSLHSKSEGFVLLTLEELESYMKNKRIQYQINL